MTAQLPKPFDPARASRTLEALAEHGVSIPASARPLVQAGFGNSPYLARTALRERKFLSDLIDSDSMQMLHAPRELAVEAGVAPDATSAMAVLRRAKRQAALAIAFADISGAWTIEQITRALTEFADVCVSSALRFLLREAAESAGMPSNDPARLESETGLVVLALGKYGAFELNYSSDIDLIVFYDVERFPFRKKDDARGAAVDIVKGLVRLLSEVTPDGYVFRVDLRLRPDAGATQVAISTAAAEAYYEGMGQNWERAAFIKARACAGDPVASFEFLKAIEPFVWRRSLDYAAIEDIHSIKRQIHAHGKHGAIAVAGHNIKLGRGGIREIEFFVQTQQLILGGRNPTLRSRGTLHALEALRARGLVSQETADDLAKAYLFLRTLEHRLQMIDDEQTHAIPKSDEGVAHIACFMGYDNIEAFSADIVFTLQTVQQHYLRLFEASTPLASTKGNLVFTGVDDDPETIQTLKGLGFEDPRHIAGAVRGWHHGRIRATRSARARELLTRLVPILLDALAVTADPDAAFAQFDRFVSRLPTGVQLFSLFLANPHLLGQVANICGSAPRLADHLGRSPRVLDALLDPGFLGRLPSREELDCALQEQLAGTGDYEGALDAARRFAKEQIFRVGVQIIEGSASAEKAGPAFANVAESVIQGLLGATEAELAASAGRVPGGSFAVVALGKLGGREITAASDLDLVFIYDVPKGIEASDGTKPLAASAYYGRLAQRLIGALTVPTAEGVLYEVDMRLRPTGNKGPVAVSLESFARYHVSEAWTWERMALTRARVICGDEILVRKVEAEIAGVLSAPRAPEAIYADAAEMRDKLTAQFPGKRSWDLKFTPGGLVDIEFVAQILQLTTAPRNANVRDANTIAALGKLAEYHAIGAADAQMLISTARIENALIQILRIAVEGTLQPEEASPGLKALLVRAAGSSDFEALENLLIASQSQIRKIFDRLVRAP